MDLVEVFKIAEQVVTERLVGLIKISQRTQNLCLLLHLRLRFFLACFQLDAFFLGDFRIAFAKNVRGKRGEVFELTRSVVAVTGIVVAKADSLDCRINGNGAAGCSVKIAAYVLFDLTEFVEGIEIFVGFYIVKRHIQRDLFACNRNAVTNAGLSIEILCFVQIIRTIQKPFNFTV